MILTRKKMYVQPNTEALSCNHCCRGKSRSITHFECMFIGLLYPACNMHVPYCHLWSTPLHFMFPHYLKNGTIFGKETLLNTKCVFWFSLLQLSEAFLILRRIERDMMKNVQVEKPLLLANLN